MLVLRFGLAMLTNIPRSGQAPPKHYGPAMTDAMTGPLVWMKA